MRPRNLAMVLLQAAVLGCGAGDAGGLAGAEGSGVGGSGGKPVNGCIDGAQAIVLTPAGDTFPLDGFTAAPIAFTATAVLGDGHEAPIDPVVLSWSVSRDDDTPPGTIHDGELIPNAAAGGVVHVEATDGCATGSADATFVLDATIGEGSDAWQEAIDTDVGAPAIVYPSDRTRIPRNLHRTLFQWWSQGLGEFRLTFEGPYATVHVYTSGAHGLCADAPSPAGCWEVDELVWSFIAASNAGETAEWTVEGLDTSVSPPLARRSPPIELGFSKRDVGGAIFYWSTTSSGIRRGRISQPEPEDYIVGSPAGTSYPDHTVECVGCHTVSRDGAYLVAPVEADSGKSLWILGVAENAPPPPLVSHVDDTEGHGFATISPDDARVVAAWKGKMWMIDRETGGYLEDLPLGTMQGTHPDWSPDDSQLVFATGAGDAPGGASLALLPRNAGTWQPPVELLAPAPGLSHLFPMFSPDGSWIAFATGVGGHGDVTAQLQVIAADGGAPVELAAANRVTSNELSDGQYQNSQPTWAPTGDLDWIAFNTQRAYGVVRPQGTQQIWVAAIDRAAAEAGEDPSYPAFRVPFQGLDENNHRAFWALDIGGGGDEPGCEEILATGDACDPAEDCCESGASCEGSARDGYFCVFAGPK